MTKRLRLTVNSSALIPKLEVVKKRKEKDSFDS